MFFGGITAVLPSLQGFDHSLIRVERIIREQYPRLPVGQERIGTDKIMDLTGGQFGWTLLLY